MGVLAWLEQSVVGVWLRESPSVWAFPFALILHTVGLAVVGGAAVIVNSYAFVRSASWNPVHFESWFQFAWAGFAVNLISGLLLLTAYPAKALTNPLFYIKLACVVAAMVQLQWLRGRQPGAAGVLRLSAIAAFVLWTAGTVLGRLLAYTYRVMMSSELTLALN